MLIVKIFYKTWKTCVINFIISEVLIVFHVINITPLGFKR
jgi:hypothetical protein